MPAKSILFERLTIMTALASLDIVTDRNLEVGHWFIGPDHSWDLEFTDTSLTLRIRVPMTEAEIKQFAPNVAVKEKIKDRTRTKIMAALL